MKLKSPQKLVQEVMIAQVHIKSINTCSSLMHDFITSLHVQNDNLNMELLDNNGWLTA